jgi:hypothetical protein
LTAATTGPTGRRHQIEEARHELIRQRREQVVRAGRDIPFVDFLALLLSSVWIVVTSVMLARADAAPSAAVAAPA